MVSCFCPSGIFSGWLVCGSWTSTPFWSIGVTTMKMISITRQTSTRGVTLMSLFTPATMFGLCLGRSMLAPLLLHEEVDQLRRGVRHLDREPLELSREVVEHPGGGNRHAETERGGHERFRDTGRHRADTAGAGQRHAVERVDDADHGAEQADEGGDGGDRRQRADALLEVRRGEQRRALDGAAGGFHHLEVRQRAGLALELERLEAGRDDPRQVALRILL